MQLASLHQTVSCTYELNPRYLLEWKLPESMVSRVLVWNAPESLLVRWIR